MSEPGIEAVDIPGVLRVVPPSAPLLPMVFDSPHSGLAIPADFERAASDESVLISADSHVDALFHQVTALGAPLLCALFPRSFMDVNRSLLDMDVALVDGPWPHPVRESASAKRGMGLIWRYAWGDEPMYARRLTTAEVEARIERYWRPYHRTLAGLIDRLHDRFGQVWHVNCHSMPAVGHALSPDPPGTVRPDFVLGDRQGQSCAPEFTALAADLLRRLGYSVAINDPFPGAELVVAFADPARGRHSLQIEINRRLYMDEATRSRNAGFDRLRADLVILTRALSLHVWSRLAAT